MSDGDAWGQITVGHTVNGSAFEVTRENIREFAEASLDFNPLHLDDKYMEEAGFGGTRFGGIIAHGMMSFALITRTMTDWLTPRAAVHRRLETRWLRPVRPGEAITVQARVLGKVRTSKGRWLRFGVEVHNDRGETTATGEAMADFPEPTASSGGIVQATGEPNEGEMPVQAQRSLDSSGFERDFWKSAARRKTWDDIVPGESRPTFPITLTREAVERLARSVGDSNPLYFGPEHAPPSSWGGLIAPPYIHIMLMFACTAEDDWMRTPGTINAGQSWSYNVPARPGDTVRMEARALDRFIKKERLFAVHDNVFYNQRGHVICSGRGWTVRPS